MMIFRGAGLGDDPGFWSSFASGLPTGFIAASPPAPVQPSIVPGMTAGAPGSMICPAGSLLVGTMCMPSAPPTPWYFTFPGLAILGIGGFIAYKMFKSSSASASTPKKEPTP